MGKGSDRVVTWLDSLAPEAYGKGADPTERGLAEPQITKILNDGLVVYTGPVNGFMMKKALLAIETLLAPVGHSAGQIEVWVGTRSHS